MGAEAIGSILSRRGKDRSSSMCFIKVYLHPKEPTLTSVLTQISYSYLLSSSLHLLSPLDPKYTSQVHAALSGKFLVPQIEEFLSLHPSTRVLIITFDAATIPNANLEPI